MTGRGVIFVNPSSGTGTEIADLTGNNCYGESLRALGGRERLAEGVLDVRIAHADRRLSRVRIVGAVLFGQLERSPLIDRERCGAMQLDVGHRIEVASTARSRRWTRRCATNHIWPC